MANSTDRSSRGGRPPRHEIAPSELLERFVEYSRFARRSRGPAAISRSGFAHVLDKSEPTLRGYIQDYNYPWPLLNPGELVLLLDDAPPRELLWVSEGWCAYYGCRREDVLWKPAAHLRDIGFADGPREEHRRLTDRLRQGPSTTGLAIGWIKNVIDKVQQANYEFRYSPYASTFYIRATPLGATQNGHVETFNVIPDVILRPAAHDSVDLLDMEQLIQRYIEAIPKYEHRGGSGADNSLRDLTELSRSIGKRFNLG